MKYISETLLNNTNGSLNTPASKFKIASIEDIIIDILNRPVCISNMSVGDFDENVLIDVFNKSSIDKYLEKHKTNSIIRFHKHCFAPEKLIGSEFISDIVKILTTCSTHQIDLEHALYSNNIIPKTVSVNITMNKIVSNSRMIYTFHLPNKKFISILVQYK